MARLTTNALQEQLKTRPQGLTRDEARERLARHGRNTLSAPVRRSWYASFASHFIHFFAMLLWISAALAYLAGMPALAAAIAAVVLINGVFSYWQEYQAERAVEALKSMMPALVRVRREVECEIPAEEVVPGDWLLLRSGDLVSADARLMRAEEMRVDLSALTGESHPAPRSTDAPIGDEELTLPPNMVFAGTSVVGGVGEAVVFATGRNTEFGRIAHLTGRQRERPSPLERELHQVTRWVTVLAVGMGVLFYGIGTLWVGLSAINGFLFAIGIIVANVPEGLLPTLTLSLAMAVRRMAARNALVSRLSAVEALGATTVILTDKTGTLTENRMALRAFWSPVSGDWHIADKPESSNLLRIAALCCEEYPDMNGIGSSRHVPAGVESAIWEAALQSGITPDILGTNPRVKEFPFDSVRKRMTTVHRDGEEYFACVKGAPEEILSRSGTIRIQGTELPIPGDDLIRAQQAHESLARQGYRVLAIATRKLPSAPDGPAWNREAVEKDLELLGFLCFADPPRASVPAALRACREAGIRVCMLTGDSGLTASAIAHEIGMYDGEPRVVSGPELDAADDDVLEVLLKIPNLLFARVTPEHKLRLVEAFQRVGEVVAVTGDGVNDAPALKRADIGVAMGRGGTEVAREAADMVLLDDDFGTIVAAVEEGRAVYENVRKFVTYIFASNVPEIVPFIAFVLFRIPLPLTVMQILAVDLGTDMVPALALGVDAPEPDIMTRPPRSRKERLLNFRVLLRSYGWLGMIEAAFCLGGFFFVYWRAGWRPGLPFPDGVIHAQAMTLSLAGIVACQIGNVFACRSSRLSAFRILKRRNPWIWTGIAAEIALLLILMYTPPLAKIFSLAPLAPRQWALLASFPFALLLLEEIRKARPRWHRIRRL